MKTETIIKFGLVDVSAKSDSTPTISDKQPFVDLNDLKKDFLNTSTYATLEQDFWKLDGTMSVIPDAISGGIGLWSLTQSGADKNFSSAPTLTVNFSTGHTSTGITLDCSPYEDYADSVNIKWYSGAVLLYSINFSPDAPLFFCEQLVTGFTKVIITFNRMTSAYRYLKLKRILYGEEIAFSGDSLVNATIVEELNPISSEITVNTLDFTVHSDDQRFNILNPLGAFKALQSWQPLNVVSKSAGTEKAMGVFYLDTWANESQYSSKFEAVDSIGMMDKRNFLGDIYSAKSVPTLISEIFTASGVEHDLDSSFSSATVSGWIPYCTCREALHQVCFAIGAVVDSSRDQIVNIKPLPTSTARTIAQDRQYLGQTIKQKQLVTGIDLTEHSFVASALNQADLFGASLAIGTYTVLFSQPHHTLVITGATITSSGANHAVINVTVAGSVTIKGQPYEDTKKVVSKSMSGLASNEKLNVLSITDAYLVTSSNSQATLDRIYSYYQNRIQQELGIVNGDEIVGEKVGIVTDFAETKYGNIEKIEIDLTGGMKTRVVVVGG